MERKVVEEFNLSDGRQVKIYEGTGGDLLTAMEIAQAQENPSMSNIVLNLMEQLVEIDGQKLPAEELKKLPLPEFMRLYTAFLNMTSLEQKKAG